MYDSKNNQSRRIIIAFVGVMIAFVMIIITISIIASSFSSTNEAKIINEYDLNADMVSEEDMSRFKQSLYDLLQKTTSADRNFDAAVRWDTLKTADGNYPTTTFLVDVDAYKQSYRVTIDQYNVIISCPKIGESKYSSSFCIGNNSENDDSINIVFGDSLPYRGYTNEDEYFSIMRSTDGSNSLQIMALGCGSPEGIEDRINKAVDDILISLGAPIDLFTRNINVLGCQTE